MTVKVTYVYEDGHPRVEYRECSGVLKSSEVFPGAALFDYEGHRAVIPPRGGAVMVKVVK